MPLIALPVLHHEIPGQATGPGFFLPASKRPASSAVNGAVVARPKLPTIVLLNSEIYFNTREYCANFINY